jgi:hypothetical protein
VGEGEREDEDGDEEEEEEEKTVNTNHDGCFLSRDVLNKERYVAYIITDNAS